MISRSGAISRQCKAGRPKEEPQAALRFGGGCSALPYCSANLVAEVLKKDLLAAEFNRVPCLYFSSHSPHTGVHRGVRLSGECSGDLWITGVGQLACKDGNEASTCDEPACSSGSCEFTGLNPQNLAGRGDQSPDRDGAVHLLPLISDCLADVLVGHGSMCPTDGSHGSDSGEQPLDVPWSARAVFDYEVGRLVREGHPAVCCESAGNFPSHCWSWHIDLHQHSAGAPAGQCLVESLDDARGRIGGEGESRSAQSHGVERKEHLILGTRLASNKVDVVDGEQLQASHGISESVELVVTNRLNVLVGEVLAGHIPHGFAGVGIGKPMADSLQQVGLPHAAVAVNEEWREMARVGIVDDALGRRNGEAIARADRHVL